MTEINKNGKANITGERIRQAREGAKLTQEQMSARLKTHAVYICRASISRIENGERSVTDIELDGISRVLNVPLELLFDRGGT